MGRALGQLTRSGRSGEPRRDEGVRVLHVADGKTVQFGSQIPTELFSKRLTGLLESLRDEHGRIPDNRADFMAATLAFTLQVQQSKQ
ncbi:MAG: hypothetical protein AABW86_02660 [Candidatus Micrarchaeota archaeon]